jgi:histidine ammonia-lyase
MQEDHVSMGWHAARKLRRSVVGLRRVLAVELLTAVRGLELRAPLAPAPATAAVVVAFVERGITVGHDRVLHDDLTVAEAFCAERGWQHLGVEGLAALR